MFIILIPSSQNLNVLLDKNWHQVCFEWSSRTLVWVIYVDGKKGNSGLHPFRATVGCALYLGSAHVSTSANKLLLSQVNVWDRVLKSQEITEFSGKCNEGVGNIRSWADLYDKNEKTLYSKPSSCKAKNVAPAEALPAPNNPSPPSQPSQADPATNSPKMHKPANKE